MPSAPSIDVTKPEELEKLAAALATVKMDPSLPAEHRIDQLTDTVVNVVAMYNPVKPPPRHRLRNTWCPDNIALAYHLKYLTQLNRLFRPLPPGMSYRRHPAAAKKRQTPLHTRVSAIIRAWTHKLTQFAKDSDQLAHFLQLIPCPPAYWMKLSLSDISSTLPSALAALRTSLKSSHRKQRSTEFRAFLHQRETQGQLGTLKMAVRTILPTKRKRHDLATLEVDGTTIVDPVDIALRLKNFKTKWFQPNDTSVVDWNEVLYS